MEKQSKISVIMPAYNSEHFVADAIASVLKQSYANIELIVIDDCSKDRTAQVIEDCAKGDARVRFIKNEKNMGVAITRNRGIEAAEGEYIAFLDSDDLWMEDKLQKQMELAVKTNADLVYTSYGFIDEHDGRIKRPFLVPKETDFERMLIKNVISSSSALIRREALAGHRFRNDVYHEDYALWMELMKANVKAVGCKEVLWYYRQVKGARNENKLRAAKERWKIYRKVLKLGILKSVYSMSLYAILGVIKYYVNIRK